MRAISGSAWETREQFPAQHGEAKAEVDERRRRMAAVKIMELIGTSSKSSDDAVQQALNEARTSLRNIKAVDVVSTGLRGDNLDEWRAHVRIAFLVERVSE
jgi:dodecin